MKTKKKELKELMQMKDTDIDYTDIPEIKNFSGWQPNPYFKPIKKPVSFRMDADLLAWFQAHPKYTHLINEACRFYMRSQARKHHKAFTAKSKKNGIMCLIIEKYFDILKNIPRMTTQSIPRLFSHTGICIKNTT